MKNKEIEELLNKIQECDSLHNNCDYLLEHDECYILTEYIEQLEEEIHKKEAMYDSLAVDYRLSQEKNEQLETDYKEANESVTWWGNRYNAVERDNRNLKNNRDKAIDKIQLLIDIGFDYDGFNKVESLKGLIDELVSYAKESRDILKGESDEQ